MARAFLLIVGLWLISVPGMSADEPKKHTSVDPSVKALADGNFEFTFKVVVPGDLVVNNDAPWKLEVKEAKGLTFAEMTYGAKATKPDLPGFVITTKTKPTAQEGSLEYSLVAFACTKNKDNCYRDVHKGTVPWKVGK
jgi:hypothetical protein